MISSLFPLIYGLVFLALLWQAFRVMGRGFSAAVRSPGEADPHADRTGKVTIHPELLDGDGRLTEEDLLTVRFSGEATQEILVCVPVNKLGMKAARQLDSDS